MIKKFIVGIVAGVIFLAGGQSVFAAYHAIPDDIEKVGTQFQVSENGSSLVPSNILDSYNCQYQHPSLNYTTCRYKSFSGDASWNSYNVGYYKFSTDELFDYNLLDNLYGKPNGMRVCVAFYSGVDVSGTPFGWACGTKLNDIWVSDDASVPVSGIISVSSPAAPPAETVFLNNPVEFSGTYNNNELNDVIQIELFSVEQNVFLTIINEEIGVQVGEDIPFSFTKELPFKGKYTGSIRLLDTTAFTTTDWVVLGDFTLGNVLVDLDAPIIDCTGRGIIGDAFCDIISWAFVPDETSLNKFSTLGEGLVNKPPFGYFKEIKEVLSGISTTTPANASFAYFGAVEAMIAPLKIGIAVLLWVLFSFWIFNRIRLFDFHI